jgi:hypothetical protein
MATIASVPATFSPGSPRFYPVSFLIPAAPPGGYTSGTIRRVYVDNAFANWNEAFSTRSSDVVITGSTHEAAFPQDNNSGTTKTETVALTAQQIADINAAAGTNMSCVMLHTTTTLPGSTYNSLVLTLLPNNDGWGDGGSGGGIGTYLDPFTLAGSGILGLTSPMRALAARVHRQAVQKRNSVELWYLDRSNGLWYAFPVAPILAPQAHPVIKRTYREPATLECHLADNGGLLTPENLNSAYNYNQAAAYDPLMDEARKILLRAGTWSYRNIAYGIAPTATLAPSSGTLSALTDGVLGNLVGSGSNYVQFNPASATAFDIVIDLGSLQPLAHCVIRFGTRSGYGTLPASVTFGVSADAVTWSEWEPRPVGGIGGDWDDDYNGRTIDVARCDLEISGRYVRFRILPTGAQTLLIDEMAVYGGTVGGVLGKNLFTGYLGDQIDFTPEGLCQFTATDVMKKLADNNEIRLTNRYQNADVGDIAWAILTQTTYWRGVGAAYDSPFASGQVGWNTGMQLTGLMMPVWQGQGNSIQGYLYDLFHLVGWIAYGDGNGTIQAFEPTYKQRLPDRVCIAAPDGNRDVRDCVRHRSGKDLRNTVEVISSQANSGGARTVVSDPNSVARYGRRRVIITDPVANGKALREKIGQYILRDYGYRLQTMQNEIAPDFDTELGAVFGFRAPSRPALFAKASAVVGSKRLRELWSLRGLEEHITFGEWKGNADWVPYVPGGPDPPSNMTLASAAGSGQVIVTWDALAAPHLAYVRGYLSTTSESAGFTQQFQVASTAVTSTIAGLPNGTQVWVYLTAVDDQGLESVPGSIVSILVGGGSASSSGWAISDLAAAFNPPPSGPDGGGNFSYEFALTWTAPANGCKRWEVYYAIGALPANPDDIRQWKYQDEFHGDWHAPGTPLSWYPRLSNHGALASGSKVYFRMLTSDRNTSDGGVWPLSNTCFVTMP